MTIDGAVRRLLGAAVLAIVLGLVLLVTGATAASAHDILVATEPANGAALEAPPGQVRLTFTDPVLDGTAQVRVDGPSGVAPIGPVSVDGSAVVVPLTAALPAGGYTVLWRVTSQDGHPVSGTFSFTVGGSASAAPAATAPSVAGGPSPSGAATSSTPVAVALLLTSLVVAVGAAAWWRRNRTSARGDRVSPG